MITVSLSGVRKFYGAHAVLDGLSWDISEGEVIGLVGPNGSGKTTLLRCIAGLDEIDEGTLHRRRGPTIAYLPQEPDLDPTVTPLAAVLASHDRLHAVERELRDLEAQMGAPEVYEDDERLARVMERHADAVDAHERLGGPTYESRCETTLLELGFRPADLHRPVGPMSGGEKKLVGIARLLVQRPDLLLLDEPDNHLDLEGKARLERLIAQYPGTVVIVSHDRYLLDVVTDAIAELEVAGQHPGRSQLTVFPGNYSEYAFEKRMALERQQKSYTMQQLEIGRLEASIARLKVFSRGGANEKFVRRWQSMQKRLDKVDRIERPIMDPRRMSIRLDAERGSTRVVETIGVEKAFGADEVLRGADLLVLNGERVGVVGANGSGKSVLFRLILGQDEPDAGRVKVGPSNTIASYAQEHETLDMNRTAIEEIRYTTRISEGEAVNHLGRFLFTYELALNRVRDLSGGQKSRLQLAKLMLQRSNVLLLDEPTNNLDIASAEVLEEALTDYDGTLLMISHDRYFLERVASRVVELDEGRLTSFDDGYPQYAAARAEREAAGAEA